MAGLVGRQLAWTSLIAFVAGMALGLLQLVFLPASLDEAYWRMLARFPGTAYRDASLELLFTLACLAVYIASWSWGSRRPWAHGTIAVLGSTNLLYHFPPLMVTMRELAARPALVAEETLTRPLVRGVMARAEVVAMSVHVTLASLAVAAIALMLLVYRATPATDDARVTSEAVLRRAAVVALVPTMLQLAVGIWLLAVLPATMRAAMMGRDLWASLCLAASLIGALGLMHVLATITFGDTSGSQIKRAVGVLLAVVLLMTTAMVQAR
jgi:hypothetical protein